MNFTVLFHLPTIVSTLVVDAINQSTLTYMLKLALNKICESNYMSYREQDLSGTTHESFHTDTIVCQYPTHQLCQLFLQKTTSYLVKTLATVLTLMWLLASMNPRVIFKISVQLEHLVALCTVPPAAV